MVLGERSPGRVGRRRISQTRGAGHFARRLLSFSRSILWCSGVSAIASSGCLHRNLAEIHLVALLLVVPATGHLVRMAGVLAVRAKKVEIQGAVDAVEEAIANRAEGGEVSAVRRVRGRKIGLMAPTLIGLTRRVVQMVELPVVGDQVALEGAVVDQPDPVQDARVQLVQETRGDLSATMIGGTAGVIAKRVDADRIGEMTRALRHEGATDGEMTAVPVRETTAGETPTAAVGEALAAHLVLSGRSGHVRTVGRHAKNVNRVSHETKRNAEPLRCACVEAVPPA